MVPSNRMRNNGHKPKHKKFNNQQKEKLLCIEDDRALEQAARVGYEFAPVEDIETPTGHVPG